MTKNNADTGGNSNPYAHEHLKVLDSLSELIFYQDKGGTILWANQAAADSLDMLPEQMLGRRCYELWYKRKSRCPGCIMAKVFHTGSRHEEEMTTPDGKIWLVKGSPIRNKEGEVVRAVEVTMDITERKQVEDELRVSKDKLNAMLQSIGDHMSVMDKDLNILWANESAKKIFGDDIIGKKCYQVYHHREQPCEPYPCLTLKAFKDGQPHEHNTQVIGKDDKAIYFHCTANVALRDAEGKPTAVIALSRDTTAQTVAQKALKASEEKYRSLITNIPDVSWTTDNKYNIVFVSPNVKMLSGDSQEETYEYLTWIKWLDRIHKDDKKRTKAALVRLMEKGALYDIEYRFLTKDNDWIWIHDRATASYLKNDKLYADGLMSDVTERKKLEVKFQEMCFTEMRQREELEKEHRSRSLSINALAHELRTPLTPLLTCTHLLAETLQTEKGSVEEELLRLIIRGAETLTLRLDELLKLARLTIGAFSVNHDPIDIGTLLREKAQQCQVLVKQKNQRLILKMPDKPPQLKGDYILLGQVLANLLSNAAKFSPEGSEIKLGVRKHYGEVIVEVSDQGEGLSAKEQKRIFQPYHRVEQDRHRLQGLGLGLAISRQIVEAHKGRIWVESAKGQGSKFSFSLPI